MLKVVFEDECLLVVDKPAGLVVTTSETHKEKTLEEILKEKYHINVERSGIVHRLDKDTSGLLVVGKTQGCWKALQTQFKSREVKKEYLALVHGWVLEKGRVEASIGRNPKNREKFTVLDGEREAVTEYEPVEKFKIQNSKFKIIFENFNKIQLKKLEKMHYGQFTILNCFPLTGRTHQIRVHLKYIGHPVVGDGKYAGRKMARLDHRFCERQFLHATKLEFTHPKSGKRSVFKSDLPKDLKKVLEILEKT